MAYVMTLRAWCAPGAPRPQPQDLIVQACNPDFLDGRVTTHPIGGAAYVHDGSDEWNGPAAPLFYGGVREPAHTKPLMVAYRAENDRGRRRDAAVNRDKVAETLAKAGHPNTFYQYASEYFKDLPAYRFVASPEGSSEDAHRHYETLLAGCVPIIERNPFIEAKYAGLPLLLTTDYSEITDEYLNAKWDEMLDQTFDFSKMFVSTYSPEVQAKIKEGGNFWCKNIFNSNPARWVYYT